MSAPSYPSVPLAPPPTHAGYAGINMGAVPSMGGPSGAAPVAMSKPQAYPSLAEPASLSGYGEAAQPAAPPPPPPTAPQLPAAPVQYAPATTPAQAPTPAPQVGWGRTIYNWLPWWGWLLVGIGVQAAATAIMPAAAPTAVAGKAFQAIKALLRTFLLQSRSASSTQEA